MANLTPLSPGTQLPRFPLAVLPTPLVPAHRLQRAIGGPLVWVKRDDLIGFGTAGNKARPLELLLGDGLERGCDVLVTGGGPGSNFCAAAAAGTRVAGIDCHLVVAGTASSAHPNLVAARAAGARLHFTERDDREEIDVAVKTLAAELAAKGRRPLSLPRGGATALGTTAFAHAHEELHAQLAAAAVVAGVLVLATGSGGSQAGLVAGSTTRHLRRYTAL
ncbi:MAG: pyridoxal-phosphate dependent enzyme, partial [Acidimicrobiales bacterium]